MLVALRSHISLPPPHKEKKKKEDFLDPPLVIVIEVVVVVVVVVVEEEVVGGFVINGLLGVFKNCYGRRTKALPNCDTSLTKRRSMLYNHIPNQTTVDAL